MERVAPRQIMYENQLPLAIESKSQRRLFFPEGGSTYGPVGNTAGNPNIIRIPINADSLLDVQHSYLQFVVKNDTADKQFCPDVGVPYIKRLRVESSGTTLEDIDNYGKLYANVLFPAQASMGAVDEATITTAGIGASSASLETVTTDAGATALTDGAIASNVLNGVVGAGGDNAAVTAAKAAGTTVIQDAINLGLTAQNTALVTKLNARKARGGVVGGVKHANFPAIAGAAEKVYNIPLVSALFNMEKYLPLVMMNAGLTVEIELGTAREAGIEIGSNTATGTAAEFPSFSIKDVRYVAHLIDLQRDFYDRMRMVMEGSGGVLQLAGTTYRHYSGQMSAGSTGSTINIPSRIKSIKSVFFTITPNSDIAHAKADAPFVIGSSVSGALSEYQFRVGSVVYPPTAVKVSTTNIGEAYCELRKAFGNLGAYDGQGILLNNRSYLSDVGNANATCAVATTTEPFAELKASPYALDFESFQKISAENGINTADRSLPMSLELKHAAAIAGGSLVDVFVMCDAIFYVNLDGSVSVSI